MGFGGSLVWDAPCPFRLLGPRQRRHEGTGAHAHGRLGGDGVLWSNREGETPEAMDERLKAQGTALYDDLPTFHEALAEWYRAHTSNMPDSGPQSAQVASASVERANVRDEAPSERGASEAAKNEGAERQVLK